MPEQMMIHGTMADYVVKYVHWTGRMLFGSYGDLLTLTGSFHLLNPSSGGHGMARDGPFNRFSVCQESFQSLLHKKDRNWADWEYPFAVVGINISFMLVQMLNLRTGKPLILAGIRFLQLLGEDQTSFDYLFCVAFQMMDAQWLIK
ncbi:protein TRANSPARENT TESTA 12-like [Hibiscus syriacus]|uniref:Protein TRANSPARENT TESTA 12-like n=1 Tax=Hibiscus syriacus TaxID=106335 RepID=A0A6A2ZHV8_HIBSY|nr:protein TRANSPARENT TESTA 12-like [Hibiscus syriacus]